CAKTGRAATYYGSLPFDYW
nr:immunoglobulin heavy chain junction region [Macaca mulatta]MOX38428.1 immunoglobulin heavy chain junction region [Macaca mulatta]MOX38658.1 immunoglobulin heavy chain junction region [Macaca mulatta]MOX38784.1 immunoglobulin heavy chain junction region [Macaca mulatta]MOX38920.1 immunoglobulin heavy chain junction region [Macaca mulatta]